MKNKIFNMTEIRKIIENNYDIGEIKEIKPILEGASSECFKATAESWEYLFKDIQMIFMNHPDKETLIN